MNRSRCLTERFHILVTVWQSVDARDTGGTAIRVASSSLTVSDGAGRAYHYIGAIPIDTEVTDAFSVLSQSLRVEVPWVRTGITPADWDMSNAVGEVAILWETDGIPDAWEARQVRINGGVSGYSWGTGEETLSLVVQDPMFRDLGEMWPPGAEIGADAFPDSGIGGDRSRAQNSLGKLPPRVYAPVGSAMDCPIMVVRDEVDAVFGVSDIDPRQLIVAARRQTSMGDAPLTGEQFWLRHPTRDGATMASKTAVAYREPILTGTDGKGGPYYYIQGDFIETFGASSVTFTTGADQGTATRARGVLAEGDQVRYTGDTDASWEDITSIEGQTFTLSAAYSDTGGIGGTGDIIRLPVDDAIVGYRTMALGGEEGADGAPISQVADVVYDMLRDARTPLDIAAGDVLALRPLLAGIDVSSVMMDRMRPYDWVASRVFSVLPIRPYRDGQSIRFGWSGTATAQEVVATLDLDGYGAAYRDTPITYDGGGEFPAARLRYAWSIPRDNYRRSIVQGGRPEDGSPLLATELRTGRSIDTASRWRSLTAARDVPTLEVESDAYETRTAAGLVSTWVVYGAGYRRRVLKIEIGQEWFWLEPGMVVDAHQSGSLQTEGDDRAVRFRVEMRSMRPSGVGSLVLSEVIE